MLDEHFLRRRGAALHAVEHDHVGAGLHRQRRVVIGPRRADLDVDRLLPVGDLAQLLDLDLEIVGAGPVRMPAGRALVDAFGQACASRRRARRSSGRAACRRRRAWRPGRPRSRWRRPCADRPGSCRSATAAPDRPAVLRVPALLRASCRRRRSWSRCRRCDGAAARAPPWPGAESEPKLMPAMVIGILSVIGFLAKRVPSVDVGAALLAIAFERIAADRGAEKQQIVEMRQLALGAEAADVVDAGRRRAAGSRRSRYSSNVADARGGVWIAAVVRAHQ